MLAGNKMGSNTVQSAGSEIARANKRTSGYFIVSWMAD